MRGYKGWWWWWWWWGVHVEVRGVHVEVKVSTEEDVKPCAHCVFILYFYVFKRVYDEEVSEEKSDKENKEKQVLTLVIFLWKKLSTWNTGRKEISKNLSELVGVDFFAEPFQRE